MIGKKEPKAAKPAKAAKAEKAPKAPKAPKAARQAGDKVVHLRHYDIIRSPVITEKSTRLSEHNKVVFNVAGDARKEEIKTAIEALFGVQVKSVNTLNRKGKRKGFRGTAGSRQDVKKAIITLEAGQSIDIAAGAR